MNRFRYDINALRAIAVISVLLYHLRIPFISGGFAGVDIFFVISGYLMTRIIFDGLDNNNFSILNFWGKRMKRIVPALIVMVLVVSVVGFFFYLPNEYKTNESNATSSLLFYSNFLYWKHSGYFDSASENNIFLHTWSLSVEWQFYLLYPLVIWGLNKFVKNRKIVLIIIASSILLLYIFSVLLTYTSPVASFYLLPPRTWELLLGGMAFLLEEKVAVKNKYISISSYLIVFLSIFFLDNSYRWPGIYTMIPVAATFLIILQNQNNFKILSNGIVQFLGRISYSVYLWHWPLIVFAQYMGYQLGTLTIISLIALSILFGFISYYYIESLKFKTSIPILVFTVLFSASTGYLSMSYSNNTMFKRQTMLIANYNPDHIYEINTFFSLGTCFLVDANAPLKAFHKDLCFNIDSTKKNMVLLGDSHAAQYSSSFEEAFKKQNIHFLQATSSGCFPFLEQNGTSAYCSELFNYAYYDFLKRNKNKIDGVILSGNWFTAPTKEYSLACIKKVHDYLTELGIPLVVIGQNETYTIPFPSVAAKNYENNTDVSNFYLEKKTVVTNDFLKDKLKDYYINVFQLNIPRLSTSFVPYIIDNNHFSKYGADCAIKKVFSDPIFINFLHSKSTIKQ